MRKAFLAAIFALLASHAQAAQSVVDASQPPYNAKADFGVTDNSVAIQAAVDYVETTFGGGTVEIPAAPGFYCLKTAPIVLHNSGVRVVLLGKGAVVAACNADISLFVMQNMQQEVSGGWLLGTNFPGCAPSLCNSTFGAASPAVTISPACVSCKLIDDMIWGGRGVQDRGGDTTLDKTAISFSYGDLLAFGGVNAPGQGSGVLERVSLDSQWPNGNYPPAGTPLNPWVPAQAYATGTVVLLGSYAIQNTQAGISGATPPALQGYGITISDGAAAWQLATYLNGCALRMDSGATEVYGHLVDITGAQSNGVCATNTAGGTNPPYFLKLTDLIISQTINSGVLFAAGHDFYLTGGTLAGGYAPYVSAVQYAGQFQGNSSIIGGVVQGGQYGIMATAGSDITISNSNVSASISSAIFAMTSKFIITGNHLAAPFYGVQTLGAIDYYNIGLNECGVSTALCISDGGSGTHKSVALNQ